MQASGFNRRTRGAGFSSHIRGHQRGRGGRGRGRYSFNGGNRTSGDVVFGFGSLRKLREEDPDNIVLDLASDRCLPAFKTLLAKTDMADDMIELLLEVLSKACDSNSPEYFNKLLVELPKSLFVMISLKGYITRLSLLRKANTPVFVEQCCKLFTEILQRIPSAFASLPLGDLEQAVDLLVRMGQIGSDITQKMEQLKMIKKESLEKEVRKREIENQRKTRSRNQEVGDVGPPPDNFREMTIIPRRDDIFVEKKPYLRKNLVHGAYENLDHYLDVQFRLLREDFLRPLREGIINLVSKGIDHQRGVFKDIRMYRNVKILYPVCSNSGLRHQIQFDNSRLKRVKWENSKRLIYGSLLCLSKDHFQTFVFATVADRNPKELAYGKLTVQFMDLTIDLQDFSRKNIYDMVETTAYFEAYSPILEGLQETRDDDLPFQNYLIECNKDIQAPQYLRRNRFQFAAPSFDFSSILLKDSSMRVSTVLERGFRHLSLHEFSTRRNEPQFENVPVLNLDLWPSMEQLGLDESQYEALKIALTREVAVIQGPPGTGKTFLGLKIAKLLLNNTKTWIHGEQEMFGARREAKQTPILVICFTNHALDQFLEGIYDFYGENENKIVRIGGRSKSEKLKECSLRAIKEKSRKKAPSFVGRSMAQVYSRLEQVEKQLSVSSNAIRKCWQDILYERTLQKAGVVSPHHFSSLMRPFSRGQPEQGLVVLQWLELVAGDDWTEQEEIVIFGEEHLVSFNGMQMATRQALKLADVDFSLCVNIKTKQAGTVVSNLPEDRRWKNESKALFVDATGVVKLLCGEYTLCESFSQINDDRWHEIGVVHSNEEKRIALYIDKRMESIVNFDLPEDRQQQGMKIGVAPLHSQHNMVNFVGSMKTFVYYRSTKYNDMVRGDENVEYEIDFMQDQRRIDDGDDAYKKSSVEPDDFDVVDPLKFSNGSNGWQVQDKKRARNKLMFKIRNQLQSEDVMTDQEVNNIYDVWQLQVRDRWRLYRKWVRDISQKHQNTIASVQGEYDRGMKKLEELRNAQNYELLREAHVIGMTTTGAAKHRKLLHRIKPKITIVEEAAEVLESHIVTALTGGCEHLILIGDHKQLRPKPTVFELGLDYQLDISLFERMVENGMPFACLRAQHRMRPEISRMMRPIYNNLLDHQAVLNLEKIKGINTNIFFVDHQVKEDAQDENQSHSNFHEAKFIGSLCRYLLQQGYSPSQITVLTPYSGQLFQLKKFVPNEDGLRVCVVDNFQGEENEIILLSLVRSQEMTTTEKRDVRRLIGFLAIDNRICVSLSRAKKGFFCIGNLSLMRAANDLWSKILDDMERRGCVGKALPLACQIHPTTITYVRNDSDFNKAPNGGCSVNCGARLDCGHKCEQICHPTDPLHQEYNCVKPCSKTCPLGHPCQRLCYQECNKCMKEVEKTVPLCKHVLRMPCYQDPSTFQCTEPCQKKLRCGHPCPNKCGDVCARKCSKKVAKKWSPCNHTCETACFVDPMETKCPQPCNSLLRCEHQCAGTCGGCKQGRIHQPCSSKCGRVMFCDHECKVPCTKDCPPCPEMCANRCPHSKCQNKCGQPCKECKEPCQWRCNHLECTKLCGEMCDRPRCNKPCRKKLKKCGHRCAGLCGEPCPGKCLVCDKEELTEIFFGTEDEEGARFIELADCGHIFEVNGMDNYIDMQEKEMKSGQSTSIKMIKCPRCQKSIRTSLRYGNIVKAILRDFEGVKKAICSSGSAVMSVFRAEARKDIVSNDLETKFPTGIKKIQERLRTLMTKDEQNVVKNQIQFLKFMTKLQKIIEDAEAATPGPLRRYHRLLAVNRTESSEIDLMKHEMANLLLWVTNDRDRFSEQELEEFNEELLRAFLMFTYLALTVEVRKRSVSLSDRENRLLEYVKAIFETGNKLDEEEKENCSKVLEYITKARGVTYTTVTEEEKQIIVKAIGLSQGHWFKCPKGHIYCIGECGGATQEAKCPECGSRIGGTHHRLLSDNTLATEMDGARHAAWSDTANNMQNWDLGQFQ